MEEKEQNLLDELRRAREERPDDGQAAARLAEHYADLGWFNEALDVYREALAASGDDFFLLLGYGNICYRQRNYAEALRVFRKLQELKPGRIEGWNNAGIVHMAMGSSGEAKTAFGKVLEIEPENAGVLINLANYYAARGDHTEAIGLFEQAIAARPDYADAWFNLGNSRCALGEWDQARGAFERALRYRREFPAAFKNLGYVYEQLKEWQKAAESYRQAAELDKSDAGAQINLANACLALENIEEAKNCFLKAVRLAPRNTSGWMGLRHIALLKGDIPTYLRATQAIVPHLTGAAVAKSVEILLELGHAAEAGEIIAAADRCGKEGDELNAQRLLVYQGQNKATGSQEELYQRLSALPAAPDPVARALMRYDYARGDYAGAKRHFAAVREPDPALQGRYVRTLLALGERDEARTRLLAYLEAQPGHNGFLFLLAVLACRDGNHDDARKYLVAALEQGFDSFDEIAANPELKLIYESLTARNGQADLNGRGPT